MCYMQILKHNDSNKSKKIRKQERMKNLFSVLLCNKFNDFISVQQEAENRRETTTTGNKSI